MEPVSWRSGFAPPATPLTRRLLVYFPSGAYSVPVRVDYRYAIMHDKFLVVDGEMVEEGSFNYTSAAEKKNAENVLVLHDSAVAQRYGQEWERLWAESKELKARY